MCLIKSKSVYLIGSKNVYLEMPKGVFCLMHLGQVRGSIYEGLRDCSEKSHRPKGVIGLMHFEQVKRSTWEGLKESFECPLDQRESSTRLLERKF